MQVWENVGIQVIMGLSTGIPMAMWRYLEFDGSLLVNRELRYLASLLARLFEIAHESPRDMSELQVPNRLCTAAWAMVRPCFRALTAAAAGFAGFETSLPPTSLTWPARNRYGQTRRRHASGSGRPGQLQTQPWYPEFPAAMSIAKTTNFGTPVPAGRAGVGIFRPPRE